RSRRLPFTLHCPYTTRFRSAAVWDSADFMLAAMPGVAVRTPEPVPGGLSDGGVHLVAFTRICTHHQCVASFNTDVAAIALGFNRSAEHTSELQSRENLVCRL